MAAATPYLLVQRTDGPGEVLPLEPGERYSIGRAPTNKIIVKDEQSSREHAEIFFADAAWYVRDLGSLNGTRLNGQLVTRDLPLAPQDEVRVGKARLTYVEKLPGVPAKPEAAAQTETSVAIRKRLGDTRFLQPISDAAPTSPGKPISHPRVERDLARLYQVALRMGQATTLDELAEVVLGGLLDAIPAEVGAVLTLHENREFDILAYRTRTPNANTYHKVSQFVSSEVVSTKQAVLAEDVTTNVSYNKRDSLTELKATSLICAPIKQDDKVVGLIHLYSSGNQRELDTDDLEFAVAVANHLSVAMANLRKQDSLQAQNILLRDQLRLESELVGKSKAIADIEGQIARVAATNATVLVRGESGVGKELVARAIHYSSPRRDGPFVCLNCAALTESLLESELFGHEKGAFTGATDKMVGKFEAADKGTIFLDEIGEMNVGTQAKLLRVLEGHSFERVGGNVPIKVDVRVVAATNQPLELAVQNNKFRRDLFFRLQVVEFRVPPLRERVDDVVILAEHFLKRFVAETGRKIKGFSPAALQKLKEYRWPGNVRELRNVVERAVALGAGPVIDADDIFLSGLEFDDAAETANMNDYRELSLADLEKEHIRATLDHTDWNKSQAANILGIERSTLDRKIKGYELQR